MAKKLYSTDKIAGMHEDLDKIFCADISIKHEQIDNMVESIADINDPTERQKMVAAILEHGKLRDSHILLAMGQLQDQVELLDLFVEEVLLRNRFKLLIDALCLSTVSQHSVKRLSIAVLELNDLEKLILAIASVPKGLPETEIIWSMKVIEIGTFEQILKVIGLIAASSPATLILAKSLVTHKKVKSNALKRALSSCKGNEEASAIIVRALSRLSDVKMLLALLADQVADNTQAGEILVSKLVQKSLLSTEESRLIHTACQYMQGDSMAGKILAMGVIDLGNPDQLERAYNRMSEHKIGNKMLACALKAKLNKLQALSLLGKKYFQLNAKSSDIVAATKEARKRYLWITANSL